MADPRFILLVPIEPKVEAMLESLYDEATVFHSQAVLSGCHSDNRPQKTLAEFINYLIVRGSVEYKKDLEEVQKGLTYHGKE